MTMYILEYKDYEVVPTQECFLIKPLRQLYNKDRTKTKEKFMLLISVVYFMADPRSSYNYILDEDERLQAIVEQEGLPKGFKIDKELQEAIDCYKEHTITTSYLLLQRTKKAADKVGKFLEDIDLNEVDDKGRSRYTISSVTTAMKLVPEIVAQLQATEKLIAKEIEEAGRARGGNDKLKAFEQGI